MKILLLIIALACGVWSFQHDTAGIWEVNLHNGAGWTELPDQTKFDIPIQVRCINIQDESADILYIKYDSAGSSNSTGIKELFRTNQIIPVHVTRIYFDSDTTATEIHFHG